MRQLIFVVPLFLLLLFLVSLFPPDFSKRIDPARFLDPDALLLINQKQLARRLDDFAATRLGSVLRSIDTAAIAEGLEVPAFRISQIDDGKKALARAVDDPVVRSVLGRDMSVALLPFDYNVATPLPEQILANLLLICRPKQVAHVQEVLERLTGEAVTEESLYGAYTIKRYLTDGGTNFATAQVDRAVLVTTNERLLRRCLDNYDRRTDTLAADSVYRATKKLFSGAVFYGYLNVAGFTNLLSGGMTAPVIGKTPQSCSESGAGHRSLYRNGFFGGWLENGTVSHKAVLTFDPACIPPELSPLFSAPPELTRSADHLAADTLWYYWTNSYAPDALLELIRRQQHEAASPIRELLSELEVSTGTSAERIAELFDNDLILALKKAPKDDLLPIPLVMIAIKSKDTASVKELVERVIRHYNLPVRRKTLGHHTVASWGEVAPISSFEPSIATADDYLLIANNINQIKEFIVPSEGSERLSESALFNVVNNGFLYTNNSLVFLNMSEISGQLKELVSWGGLVLAIKDRTIAAKSKIIIDQLINPLLDGLAMYSIIGTRKYLRGEQVIMEATAVIDDGK